MKKIFVYAFSILIMLGIGLSAKAVCPVCTIAVGCAVGLSRYLKIDDSITGLWIGGFLLSTSIWTIQYLRKKNLRFPGMSFLVLLIYYGSVVLTLHWTDMLGIRDNCLWGIDKLLWGTIVGSILFLAGTIFSGYLKKHNDGKVYFPFQKVVMPIIPLLIMSLIAYLATR